ncbi:MAG: ABC transporter ATP-binding protein [Solirubrobacterales bacterium]|nr:ABC transporter ATP-binding protein [Solirubrobacterales bacterium]
MSSIESRSAPIVVVKDLNKRFEERRGMFGRTSTVVEAVSGLSFSIAAGGSVALVGESGSGKTTTARILVGLEPPTSGSVSVDGLQVTGIQGVRMRRKLAGRIQMVFQDPYVSLDPRQSVRRMLDEVLRVGTDLGPEDRKTRIGDLIESVGLPARSLTALPRELSGGQRQRAAIARALAVRPRVLVLDEAVSALDTSVQAQILNLLDELRDEFSLAYLVITHDLAVARQIADEALVMRRGEVIETGPVDDLLHSPKEPYTQALIDSIPHVGMDLSRSDHP